MRTRREPVRCAARVAAVAAVAVTSLLFVAAPAAAHDELLSMEPAVGAVLDSPPDVATFTYSRAVAVEFVQAALTPPGGDEVRLDPSQLLIDGAAVAVPLSALAEDAPEGTWTVIVRTVGVDGHPVVGTLEFAAGAGPATAPRSEGARGGPNDASPAATSVTAAVEPSPAAVDAAVAAPTATAAPATSIPAAAVAASGGLPSGTVAALIIGVVVVLGGIGALALARRR